MQDAGSALCAGRRVVIMAIDANRSASIRKREHASSLGVARVAAALDEALVGFAKAAGLSQGQRNRFRLATRAVIDAIGHSAKADPSESGSQPARSPAHGKSG